MTSGYILVLRVLRVATDISLMMLEIVIFDRVLQIIYLYSLNI